ncbi:GNAT family N-acetyltransferase [Microtetraspora sp. NBRC 16547]|uniref:GNAT family N-acetyltransferase n=1 Tax=Microtetraspora sp. NBRC 16547 TaxID=3030993 RepID=UPI0024A0980D|nr:GNAT family N-acetyltransferase [Microtetraspora sp. NBRC 16547]GLW99646.1 N-acetyltransferase [Microtetraspora sp. NBRC 16547]
MNFSVRQCEPVEAEEVLRVKNTSWQEAYRGLMPDDHLDGLSVTAGAVEHWRAMMADPARGVVVGEIEGRIVGLSAFGPAHNGDAGGEVYAIYTLRECWSRGLGSALMARSLARLRELGHREVGLWVLEDNSRARRFYERTGFVLSGRMETTELSGVSLSEVHYRMTLTSDAG